VSGFKKFVRSGIIVPVATSVRSDVNLEIGSKAETVSVEGGAPLLKTESGELSHNDGFPLSQSLPQSLRPFAQSLPA
jgi:hypothetical protein